MSLLQVDNLCVEFTTRRGVLRALDGISLNLEQGEFLGIVGESGAGKSMLGNAILGLIDPPGKIVSGDIRLSGKSIVDHVERIRGAKISMIFQDPLSSLNPLKTIGAQLIETIELHTDRQGKAARERAETLLGMIGIDADRLSAYPHQFSGGMRQRVVIALAMASEPEIIIADEPTTALDVSVQAQVLNLMRDVCRAEGTSVMLVTHDMGVIGHWTDRVGVMYAGRLIELGATQQIISQPRHPYTQGLIASTPAMDATVATTLYQIPGSMPSLNAIPSGCAFHPRCSKVQNQCQQTVPALINQVACHLEEGA